MICSALAESNAIMSLPLHRFPHLPVFASSLAPHFLAPSLFLKQWTTGRRVYPAAPSASSSPPRGTQESSDNSRKFLPVHEHDQAIGGVQVDFLTGPLGE